MSAEAEIRDAQSRDADQGIVGHAQQTFNSVNPPVTYSEPAPFVVQTASLSQSFGHTAVPLAMGAACLAGCAVVGVMNPTDAGPPLCPSKALFGIDCPLCGATRAVGSLVRGNFLAALDHNVLFTASVPILIVWWAVWLARSIRHQPPPTVSLHRTGWALTAIVLVAFTVIRNLEVANWTTWLASTRYR